MLIRRIRGVKGFSVLKVLKVYQLQEWIWLLLRVWHLWSEIYRMGLFLWLCCLNCSLWDPSPCGIFGCNTQILAVAHSLSCSPACEIFVPWPDIEPTSRELQGKFLTTRPPGSPRVWYLEATREARFTFFSWGPSFTLFSWTSLSALSSALWKAELGLYEGFSEKQPCLERQRLFSGLNQMSIHSPSYLRVDTASLALLNSFSSHLCTCPLFWVLKRYY